MVFLLALLCVSQPANAVTSMVKTSHGEVWVDYKAPKNNDATIVLLNGLTYSLGDWDKYVKALEKLKPTLGILRFDMIGMGKTLLKSELPVQYQIPYTDQVDLTAELMGKFHIARAYVAGLSYGGGIAVAFGTTHPELVQQLILMAPFTEPLSAMDQYIRNQVAATRISFPMNPASDDELYDFFLRQFIYQSYPALEPSVVENPYKLEGIFRMVQGIRKYETLRDAAKLPANSVHLMIANQDQYIQKEVHDRFWKAVPESARASRIDISETEHKIPEAIPAYAAAWTVEILSGRPELNQGRVFAGSTKAFTATSGSNVIQLKKAQ